MKQRKGDYIETYTGKAFYVLDPHYEDICIEDIAHSLSNMCRFAGHTKKFYSVAQHSVLVMSKLPTMYRLWGLLHDASEAYLVDLPRPIKHGSLLGDEYRKIEPVIQSMVYSKFGLRGEEPAIVKEVDDRMIPTERRDLLVNSGRTWMGGLAPYNEIIMPWSPDTAECVFLSEFYNLVGGK